MPSRVPLADFPILSIKNLICPLSHARARCPASKNFIVLMLYPLTIPFEKLVNGEGFLKQLEWHADGQSTMVVWDLNKEVGQEGMLQAP